MKYRIFQLVSIKSNGLTDEKSGIGYWGRHRIIEEITTPYLDSSTRLESLEEAERHIRYAKERENLDDVELIVLTVFE